MKPDLVAISRALRAVGLDLDPGYWLPVDDGPVCIGPDRYAFDVIGRMCFEPAGTKEVRWTGKAWEVQRGWLKRVGAPAGEAVFDETLGRLAK